MKLLVTGFGPFGSVAQNPSAELAASSGRDFRVLEVSFRAVDAFLEEGLFGYDGLLAIGVNARAPKMALETVARNAIGPAADVLGEVRGPGPIDPRLPRSLAATLWPAPLLQETDLWTVSADAGDYLCNYLFFRSASVPSALRVGFLHVPLVESLQLSAQKRALAELLEAL